jgi:hypothetical protein
MKEPAYNHDENRQINPAKVLTVMVLIALIVPDTLGIHILNDGNLVVIVNSLLWVYQLSNNKSNFTLLLLPLDFLASLLYRFFRVLFVWQMYRFYKNESTKRFTIAIGICSELFMYVLFEVVGRIIVLLLGQIVNIHYVIPIPILFLVGYVLIRYYPPSISPNKWDLTNDTKWWGGDTE